MLDEVAYIGDQKNAMFAQAITRTGKAVGVSLWLTDPPAVFHLCFHLSGLKATDLLDEPRVACLGKDMALPAWARTWPSSASSTTSVSDP
jgi:hypothetical protein